MSTFIKSLVKVYLPLYRRAEIGMVRDERRESSPVPGERFVAGS
jgi:hypothetical protein